MPRKGLGQEKAADQNSHLPAESGVRVNVLPGRANSFEGLFRGGKRTVLEEDDQQDDDQQQGSESDVHSSLAPPFPWMSYSSSLFRHSHSFLP